MKAFGAFLAGLWLLIAATATVQAAPTHAEPPCHMAGMSHSTPDHTLPAVMPCCSQPIILPDPVAEALVRRAKSIKSIRLPRLSCPAGQSPACEPQPPKI